jgi:hypothetical protein
VKGKSIINTKSRGKVSREDLKSPRQQFVSLENHVLSSDDLEQHPDAEEYFNEVETKDGDAENEVGGPIG